MEWKSNLKRTQSLRSVPSSCDKPVLVEAGLRDRKASVSQLVARFQAKQEVSASTELISTNYDEPNLKEVQQEISLQPTTTMPSPNVSGQLESNLESKLELLLRRNDEKQQPQTKTNLRRSKSMGSLQNCTGTIVALKALFESKGAEPHKVKGSFRAASHTAPSKAADIMPALSGEAEGRKPPADKQKTPIPATALAADVKTHAKQDNMTKKVVNHTQIERRKTIAGIDFEKIATSQDDEKRRSIADFRYSSFIQPKEKPPVSVKAISALYLSKVAPGNPTDGHSKTAQDQSFDSGKTIKLKMLEDSQQKKDDLLLPPSARHQPGAQDVTGSHSNPAMSSQPSKQKLYHHRQKCELRRLLKHTHPEVKVLDEIVDEELAEVLSSESGLTAAETRYEGEVLSRRSIFENQALSNKVDPEAPKIHMAEGTVEGGDFFKQSALSEQPWDRLHEESSEGITGTPKMLNFNEDPNADCEETMARIDVQSARRMFESQFVDTARSSPDKFEGKVVISEDETGAVQKRKQEFEMCCQKKVLSENKISACIKSVDLTEMSHQQGQWVHVADPSSERDFPENHQVRNEVSAGEAVFEDESVSPPNSEGFKEIIKTSAALFRNNPFISTNVEREQSHVQRVKAQNNTVPHGGPPAEDILPANVKNRAHLFESMPFDKIRHQNKDEMETMVENISETLNSLYHFSVIHSDGSIIEVNETMIAKKAKYILSQDGPKIKYNEVAEGGAQNFILQLLPRTNLKPEVIYLKEDSQGNVEATTVNVPVHQHHFTANQDTEFKTANVVQIVEDILSQDNSLRKGVIIQEDEKRCVEIIVYSLYNYAEGDVKSYCPPQRCSVDDEEPECEIVNVNKTEMEEPRKGDVKSTINCLLATTQEQTCPGSVRPEVTVKGNVKLFRSCIEKGDLEYLKTLQAQPVVQEQESSQTAGGDSEEIHHKQEDVETEEIAAEWAPVDVQRLKNIFSADQSPVAPKQMINDNLDHSAKTSPAFPCQNVPPGKGEFSTECDERVFSHGQVVKNHRRFGGQAQEKSCNFKVPPQGSYPCLETQDNDMVHQAELVEVADEEDEILNLQAAIHSLHQATMEAKEFHHATNEKPQPTNQGLSKEHTASLIASEKMKNPEAEAGFTQEKACGKPELKAPSASYMTSEHKSESQYTNTETCCADGGSVEKQTTEASGAEGQEGTAMSSHSSATKPQQEDDEDIVPANLQAALKCLEKSNLNVSRGDFRAAMIYRNSSKSYKERSKFADSVSAEQNTQEQCSLPKSKSTPYVTLRTEEQLATEDVKPPSPSQTTNKLATSTSSKNSRGVVGPKPAIPPKPEYLKMKNTDSQSTKNKNIEAVQNTTTTEMKTQFKKENAPQPIPTTSMSNKDVHTQGLPRTGRPAEMRPSLLDPEKYASNELVGQAFQMSKEIQINHQAHSSKVTQEEGRGISDISTTVDKNIVHRPEGMSATGEEKCPQNNMVKVNGSETDESHVDFHEACQKFGGKKVVSGRSVPINPKRIRIAQNDNKTPKCPSGDNNSTTLTHVDAEPKQILIDPSHNKPNAYGQIVDTSKPKNVMEPESKVVMREKKGKPETEDERRQRLSVHMDEIMRGNITAALEIFDNLQKQQELQNILTKVEEIEQDTSSVDVKSLRRIFENVPAWVINSQEKIQNQTKVEHRAERSPLSKDDSESMCSMIHVFGDLERASEEIMNLKEQTLARLMDIEEAIKKALYSVSTLKSESDISGLSGLFKESLGTVQGSLPSGNIRKISIGSSRSKAPQAQGSPTIQQATSLPAGPCAGLDAPFGKPQAGPPSSPAFISIQSAARKEDKTQVLPQDTRTCLTCQHSPKTEEKFRTTKTLRCNSAAQSQKMDLRKGGQKQSSYPLHSPHNSKRELSVLEVQSDPEGSNIIGTKTVTENYERTDNFGNQFYTTKTSTIVTTQPGIMALSRDTVVTSPTTYQVTTHPEVRLPINQKP